MSVDDSIKRHLSPLLPLPTRMVACGRPSAPVKAVVFDIYGTLLISASGDIGQDASGRNDLAQVARLLRRFNVQRNPQGLKEDLIQAIIAHHNQKKAEGIDHPEVVIESIWQSVLQWHDIEKLKTFALEYELAVNPVWPMPHLWRLLKGLSDADIPLGIISNAQFYTPLIFESLAGASLESLGFDPGLMVLSYRLERAKPSLHLFKTASRQLFKKGIDTANAIYVGNDMRKDILPAKKTGFQTALFAGDARSLRLHRKAPDCCGPTADMIVTDLMQLQDLINTGQV